MDYDKVMVMDKGRIAEFGEPYLLLVNDVKDKVITSKGVFASMCLETGRESS